MFTLAKDCRATARIDVKKSKFLAVLVRADTEEQAREVIAQEKSAYPDARHHCSAFVIANPAGPDQTHSSDDGEPSGTAGPPILDALLSAGLSNVVAVVTRYFGGTLLGTGGLVSAYTDATVAAIDNAQVVQVKQLDLVEVIAPVEVGGRLDAEVRRAGWEITDARWGSDLRLQIAIDPKDRDRLSDIVATVTREAPNLREIGKMSHEVRQ